MSDHLPPTDPSIRECHRCAHPIRSSRTPLSEAPGTRVHAAHGLCRNCYYRRAPETATNPGHFPGEWALEGSCAQSDPEAFFPAQGRHADEAVAICRRCPVLLECRNHSIQVREPYGVWGGLREDERWAAITRLDQKNGREETA